jgi:hypothetical protein
MLTLAFAWRYAIPSFEKSKAISALWIRSKVLLAPFVE